MCFQEELNFLLGNYCPKQDIKLFRLLDVRLVVTLVT